MSEFELLAILGVRVIEVEDLGRDAHYLPDSRLLLIDSALTPEQRENVSCHALSRAFDLPRASSDPSQQEAP